MRQGVAELWIWLLTQIVNRRLLVAGKRLEEIVGADDATSYDSTAFGRGAIDRLR